jgi:RimJ/RimL family protein N-acetyltransferase
MNDDNWNCQKTGLQLRKFTSNNITDLHIDALNDREHMKFSRQRFITHTPLTARRYFEELEEKGGFALGIFDINQNNCKGTITISPVAKTLSMGFLVYPEYANKGLLSAVLPCVLALAYREESINWIHIGTHLENLPMQRVAMKNGFLQVDKEWIQIISGTRKKMTREVHFLRPRIFSIFGN